MLSVVVIGRNEAADLGACLRSARHALRNIPHELLYVDSRSSDASLAIAQAEGARCYLLRTERPTAGLARRVGTREARGEHLLFLDGDMLLEFSFAETAITVMEVSGYDGAVGIRHDLYLRGDKVASEDPNYYRCTARREAPEFGGAILLRADALAAAGGWAANVATYEEAELHARLSKQASRVIELPVPMIRHIDRVRDERGWSHVLFSSRRLGLGQALNHALRAHSALALLRRERTAFLCWLLDALCVAAFCFGGWRAWGGCLIVQALEFAAFLLRGQPRGFVGQKLLLGYLPAGFLSYRKRDEGYDWVAE